MIAKKIVIFIWAILFVTGSMGGCECQRDVLVDDGPEIDLPPISKVNPEAERPYTHFASDLHTDDVSLNKFVENAMKTCEDGDYDAFRQLFGTAYTPAVYEDFKNVWHNVRDIQVCGLGDDTQKKETYYLHVKVRYRQPDSKGRLIRDAVVIIFKEAGEWRLGHATKDIINKVLKGDGPPESDTQG